MTLINDQSGGISRIFTWIPILGISAYVLLYFIASSYYGGVSESYTWSNHLLCDMLALDSKQGYSNGARSIAIIANTLLFVGMSAFFYILPYIFESQTNGLKWMSTLGIIAMIMFFGLFTDLHDFIVLMNGLLGCCIAYLLIKELTIQPNPFRSYLPVICLVLSLMTFVGYQFKIGSAYLPSFQKYAFIIDAVWIGITCKKIRDKISEGAIITEGRATLHDPSLIIN